MSREEHVRKAERLLELVGELGETLRGAEMTVAEAEEYHRTFATTVALAQVHATLATVQL